MKTTGLSERLAELKAIGDMAMAGKSDEMIAKEFNESVWAIANIRHSLGILHHKFTDIMEGWKSATILENGRLAVNFRLDVMHFEDLKIADNKPTEFTGKIADGKLVISFKNVK